MQGGMDRGREGGREGGKVGLYLARQRAARARKSQGTPPELRWRDLRGRKGRGKREGRLGGGEGRVEAMLNDEEGREGVEKEGGEEDKNQGGMGRDEEG
jgi:hypothetical protein